MTLLDRLLVQTFTRIFQPGEPVLEIGSHQLKAGGDESYHDLRPFVPRKEIYRIGFFDWSWGRLC